MHATPGYPLLRREEKECRFCSRPLPSWLDAFLPKQAAKPRRPASVNVHGPDGSVHRVALSPGLAGRRKFAKDVRQVLGLPHHAKVEFNFEVALPAHSGLGAPLSVRKRGVAQRALDRKSVV